MSSKDKKSPMHNLNKKFDAFFHDPALKPIVLSERKGHEKVAQEYKEILKALNIDIEEDSYKDADIISSSMDRFIIPKDFKFELDDWKEKAKITHPISGEIYDFKRVDFGHNDYREDFSLKSVIEILSQSIDDSNKFILLWEIFPELLQRIFNNPIGAVSYLPADARTPDHSIWEHLSNATILSSLENPAFLLFTISPIQKFIGASRSLRDFWSSSYLISYLSWIGIKTIIEKYGPDAIIFPDLHNQPLFINYLNSMFRGNKDIIMEEMLKKSKENINVPSLPDRILSLVEKDDKDILKDIEENIKIELFNIADFLIKEFKVEDSEKIKNHILNYFNFSGLVFPLGKEEGYENTLKKINNDNISDEKNDTIKLWESLKGYSKYKYNIGQLYEPLYNLLEKFAASTKNLKVIENNVPEKGYKCTLCGERATLEDKDFWIKLSGQKSTEIKKGERLCGVCLLKRFFPYYLKKIYGVRESFPSTAEISQSVFQKETIHKRIRRPEMLYEDYFKLHKDEIENEEEKEEYKKLMQKYKIPAYYAIIMFDGDNMGKVLSGNALNENLNTLYHPDLISEDVKSSKFYKELSNNFKRKPLSMAIHRIISRSLRNYTIEFVKDVVEKKGKGKVIYAGGDDVMAVVPLDYLWGTINLLRGFYTGEVEEDLENEDDYKWKVKYNKQGSGWIKRKDNLFISLSKKLSASVGVSIVHWEEPLSIAIRLAKNSLEEIKDYGKNGFFITLKKRSGEIRKFYSPWYKVINNNVVNVIDDLLIELQKKLKDDYISTNFIYTLKKEFYSLGSVGDRTDLRIKDIFYWEMNRLMVRSIKKEKEETKKWISNWIEKLFTLSKTSEYLPFETGNINVLKDVNSLIGLFEIVKFISEQSKYEKQEDSNNEQV